MSRLNQEQFESWQRYLKGKERIQESIKKPVVAYGGTSGSYSEDASMAFFGEDAVRIACPRFQDVFKSIAGGSADYGVIPIENSTTGSVKDVFDLMLKYDCYIIGETQVRVDHCLLGTQDANIEDVTDVFSHEQSLMQCSVFLEENPQWEQHPYHNNALAAEKVAKEGNPAQAAIASNRAGQIHGLKVLAEHINFLNINTTRFIIIADHPENRPGTAKTSIFFAVGHSPGALVRVLNIFDQHQMNLCKIESRPNRKKNWEYNFFVDIEGESMDERLDRTVKEVIGETTEFRFLGNYPIGINED